jgi:uncharacterized protein YjiS (DUF1127 family)
MAHVINTASTGFNLIGRIRSFFEDTKGAWALNAEYRRTYAELDNLSNRELADIGVGRCDIADISRLHVYGR